MNTTTALRFALVAAAALALACAANDRPKPAPAKGVRVTYLVYSGRPNPSIVLDEAQARQLIAPLLEATRKTERAEEPHPILGYNGIVIENLSNVPGLPARLHVVRGRVDVSDGAPETRADPERQMERALLDEGVARGALDRPAREMIGL